MARTTKVSSDKIGSDFRTNPNNPNLLMSAWSRAALFDLPLSLSTNIHVDTRQRALDMLSCITPLIVKKLSRHRRNEVFISSESK
jgi:hypothetical protein